MRIIRGLTFPFIVIGLISLFLAAKNYCIISTFIKTANTAEGLILKNEVTKVTKNTELYYPVVQFKTVKNSSEVFKSAAGNNPPLFKAGDKVKVYYSRENSKNAVINSFITLWSSIAVKAVIGIIFLISGIIFLAIQQQRKKLKQRLKKNGVIIVTTITGIKKDEQTKINWRHPYRIYSELKSSGHHKTFKFISDEIWFNPESYLKDKTIKVFVEADDYNKYWMDIAFLPVKPDKLSIANQESQGKITKD